MNAPMLPQRSARPRPGSVAVCCEAAVSRSEQFRSQAVRFWWVMAVLVLSCWLVGQAAGQGTATVGKPLPESLKARNAITAMERARTEGLTKADFNEQWGNYRAFQAYYTQYLFGKLQDPTFVAEYGTIMQSLQEDMDRALRSRSPSHAAIKNWVLQGAAQVAKGNNHPSARINATLMLAYLDDKPADPRAGTPPVPSKDALVPLVGLYRDANTPDGVKAAALQGIQRHAQLGALPANARTPIATLMQELATSQPPAGRDPLAHAFLQRYAVDILNELAAPATTPQTAQTLVSISTAAESPDLIAAYAAAKLGQLQAGQAVNADPQPILTNWAARLSAVVDAELARIANLDPPVAVRNQPPPPIDPSRRMAAGSMGEMGPGGYGPGGYGGEMMGDPSMSDMGYDTMPGGYDSSGYDSMMGDPSMMGMGYGMGMPRAKPQPPEVVASRRRINQVFQQLQTGVTGQPTTGRPQRPAGLLVAETAANKAAFDKWITAVDTISKAINQNTLDNRKKYVDELQVQSEALKKLAGIPLTGDPIPGSNQPGSLVGGTAAASAAGAASATGATVSVGAPATAPPPADAPLAPGDSLLEP